jgi:hypothetical protein
MLKTSLPLSPGRADVSLDTTKVDVGVGSRQLLPVRMMTTSDAWKDSRGEEADIIGHFRCANIFNVVQYALSVTLFKPDQNFVNAKSAVECSSPSWTKIGTIQSLSKSSVEASPCVEYARCPLTVR